LQQLRDKSYNTGEAMLANMQENAADIEEIQWKDSTLEQLGEAINDLNKEQQYCLRAFYLQKQPYHAIMEATGYSFAQVKSYIQNGKRNLKLILLKKQATGNG
jgi:DNA-directed RNA polymerase specialized sigma24 family protein